MPHHTLSYTLQVRVSALLSPSAVKHERVPMSCSQRLDAFDANNWTKQQLTVEPRAALKLSPDGMQHFERQLTF